MKQDDKPPVTAIVDHGTYFVVLSCDQFQEPPARFRKVFRKQTFATYGQALSRALQIEGKL